MHARRGSIAGPLHFDPLVLVIQRPHRPNGYSPRKSFAAAKGTLGRQWLGPEEVGPHHRISIHVEDGVRGARYSTLRKAGHELGGHLLRLALPQQSPQ